MEDCRTTNKTINPQSDADDDRGQRYEFQDDFPFLEPAENEISVRVTAVGFCHDVYHDLSVIDVPITLNLPFHTSVGLIVKFGDKANSGKWSIGDRVGVARLQDPVRTLRWMSTG